MSIAVIHGSPSGRSRSSLLAELVGRRLLASGRAVEHIVVRMLPPAALIGADAADEAVRAALLKVEHASAVIFATPVYKGAYSGLLKLFIDLLPHEALAGKLALPLVTGGGPAHFMALDCALKPVLAALGARTVLNGVFATDAQIGRNSGDRLESDAATSERIERTCEDLIRLDVSERIRHDIAVPTPHPGPVRGRGGNSDTALAGRNARPQ